MNTYEFLGIPEALAVVFGLVGLSLALAPFAAGADFGPLKIPRLNRSARSRLRVLGPGVLAVVVAGFFPFWRGLNTQEPFSHLEVHPLDTAMAAHVTRTLGSSRWIGGQGWGRVEFDESGTKASYNNTNGRPPGVLEIIGFKGMSGYVLVGTWQQPGETGEALISDRDADHRLQIFWGAGFVNQSEWLRDSN